MNKRLVYSVTFLGLWLPWSASGQNQDVSLASFPPPKAPFVKRAPLGTQWHVTIETPNSPTANGGVPPGVAATGLQVRVGLNKLQSGVITYSDGSKTAYCVAFDRVIEKTDDGKKEVYLSEPCEDGLAFGSVTTLKVKGFPATCWIAEKFYRGVEMVGEIPCYKYVYAAPHLSQEQLDAGVDPGIMDAEAWISVTTGYPVQAKVGYLTYRFSPVTAWAENVIPPAGMQAEIGKMAAQRNAADLLNRVYR